MKSTVNLSLHENIYHTVYVVTFRQVRQKQFVLDSTAYQSEYLTEYKGYCWYMQQSWAWPNK